jgi:hypothetical protein
MMTRRGVCFAAASLGVSKLGVASAAPSTTKADFLFVQSARGMTYDASTKTLTLVGVSPITFFSRIAPSGSRGT